MGMSGSSGRARSAASRLVNEREIVLQRWAETVVPRAVAYARTLLPVPDDAEDVVHDALVRILGHPEYDLERKGERILFRSVTNACINRWKRRRPWVSLEGHCGEPLCESLCSTSERDPALMASASELDGKIGRALSALPPNQRAALELKALGYSLQEIAEMISVSPSNAGVLVHRARRAVARRIGLKDNGEE